MSAIHAALWHARHGRPVFPVDLKKRPCTEHGFKDATLDEKQIREWWEWWPLALIGVPTGRATGILVADIDMKNGVDGEDSWNKLLVRFGGFEPRTFQVATPSGGRHLWFRYPDIGAEIRNSAGRLGEGVDIRADGGSIIAPGSGGYGVIHKGIEPATCPEWLTTFLRLLPDMRPIPPKPKPLPADEGDRVRAYVERALYEEVAAIKGAGKGQRNHTLFKASAAIGSLVAGGCLPESEANAHLWHAGKAAGLDNIEINRTITSGFKAGRERPRRPGDQ
ncbi:hypothetical protein GOD80_25905 [Sinorhizobium medicae]|nr:hypothetical protein [Sinorhizobium medicae]MDX0590161.1 hypothetical protein [Sinorhizobium medicae]MDX0808597.1 hypothetical protein [Sinorhizobium medicae]MDX2385070.1 hypothetical protein [Sinorhizobium medicae]